MPKGKLEGPFVFKSQVFSNTIRKYLVYAPAQIDAAKLLVCSYSRMFIARKIPKGFRDCRW